MILSGETEHVIGAERQGIMIRKLIVIIGGFYIPFLGFYGDNSLFTIDSA